MNMIAEITATVVDVLFLLWFITRFNDIPLKKRPITALWATLLLVYQLTADHFLYGFDLLYMLGSFLIAMGFALSLRKKFALWPIFSATLFVIEPMLFNSMIYSVFSLFIDQMGMVMQGSQSYVRVIYIIICKLAQFAFYKFMLLIFRKEKDINVKSALLSFLFTVATALGLGALMKMAAQSTSPETDVLALALAIILVLLNIILYIMINQVQQLLRHKYELAMLNKQRDFERSRMEEVNTIWANIRKLKHDLKNHFGVVKGLLNEGKYDSGIQYFSELDNTVNSMGDLIKSGNTVIDYVINSKLSNLDGVQVLVSGYVGNFSDVDDIDMVSILGNILDNAIEAQEKVTGEKRIELLFLQKNSNRIIICKNSIGESVLKNNKRLNSTKSSPELHGLGHQIVETTVSKYRGLIDYFEENNNFGVQIILPYN